MVCLYDRFSFWVCPSDKEAYCFVNTMSYVNYHFWKRWILLYRGWVQINQHWIADRCRDGWFDFLVLIFWWCWWVSILFVSVYGFFRWVFWSLIWRICICIRSWHWGCVDWRCWWNYFRWGCVWDDRRCWECSINWMVSSSSNHFNLCMLVLEY